MASNDELACIYSALILADDEITITAEKIQTLLKAANVSVEPFWPGLFAKALGSLNVMDLVTNLSSGVGAAPAGGAGAAAGGGGDGGKEEEKKEEKKEESEESDDDMGFGLFD